LGSKFTLETNKKGYPTKKLHLTSELDEIYHVTKLRNKSEKLTIKKIPDFVEINFEVGHLDVELEVFVHGVDVVEDIVDNPRNDA
jgi:hypothetical protein